MTLAIVYSRSCGIDAPLVTVEAHLSKGMAGFNIVGLAETAVKESKDRVRSALMNANFEFPSRRITVNLAPADLPKEGGRFDLPIALGILAASKQLPLEIFNEYEFAGELALSGELRPIRGALPVALGAYRDKRKLIVPKENADEAAIISHAQVYAAEHLLEVCGHLQGSRPLFPWQVCSDPTSNHCDGTDMSDVRGQTHAKRALEIAAAGGHNLLFIGPPGTGKTMLANRLSSLLPRLTESQSLEVAAIMSISTLGFSSRDWMKVPFRSPHHSSSSIALVGGGRPPRPGEISLAHHGVLFLDELPEFSRQVLEALREPLESGCITISRAAYQTIFPAQFQLIAAMNPCPCGYGGQTALCHCHPEQIRRYQAKISGPLLDRIDMHVEVARLSPVLLQASTLPIEKSADIRRRVIDAQQLQFHRQGKLNRALSPSEIDANAKVTSSAMTLLQQAMQKFNLSARAYHRIIKLALTIADLDKQAEISEKHLSEALSYRCFDRLKSVSY